MDNNNKLDLHFDIARMALKNISRLKPWPKDWPEITTHQKLKSYAFYKQATKGKCNLVEPEWWKATARYKWKAWRELQEMSHEEAKWQYVNLSREILDQFGARSDSKSIKALTESLPESERISFQKCLSQISNDLTFLAALMEKQQSSPDSTLSFIKNKKNTSATVVGVQKLNRWFILILLLLLIWKRSSIFKILLKFQFNKHRLF